jgi:hypothetical protein
LNEILNEDMKNISAWAAKKHLTISSSKSQTIYFTPHNKEINDEPEIYYEGSHIPVCTTIKILGLWFNSMNTYMPHEKAQKSKGSSCVPLFKAVMGTGWNLKKEDGIIVYKSFIAPVLGNGGPIFYPVR